MIRRRDRLIPLAAALALALLLVVAGLAGPAQAETGTVVPRTVLSLYDGSNKRARTSAGHQLAEAVLNHLGLEVVHLDVTRRPLPDPASLPHVRGVLAWIESDTLPDPAGYMTWLERLAGDGKRLVLAGYGGIDADRTTGETPPRELLLRHWALIGLRPLDQFVAITYDVTPRIQDAGMIGFERPLAKPYPPFVALRSIDPANTVHLRLGRDGIDPVTSDLVVTGPKGGYLAPDYGVFRGPDGNAREWIVDPLKFFAAAFDTAGLPKPDATTLAGRRIYYSHIDGDGWNNITEIPSLKREQLLSARVVMNEAIVPFPDLPVTVAPIVGDLHPDLYAREDSVEVARDLFALPQVEAGSHTHSHPFQWSYFVDYDRADEERFLPDRGALSGVLGGLYGDDRRVAPAVVDLAHEDEDGEDTGLGNGYARPRAYLDTPFDLDEEISGSAEWFTQLLPPGKRVEILQWSGDTSPFELALRKTREAGMVNINGGDTRFDREYPSLGWVAPTGRRVGAEIQIYASNSNENTYTDLWTDRYFGFRHLVRTLENTEHPVRLKPLNIYYHMYSGQKLSSLNALLANLHYARSQSIVPVTAATFARIAAGVFTTRLEALDGGRWRVLDRGGLQTLRFDAAAFQAVDFARSTGVVGQTHYQGSLYVALDPAVAAPVVALRDHPHPDRPPAAPRPYLMDARWPVRDVAVADDGLAVAFTASGYGAGEMRWKVPGGAGPWIVEADLPDGPRRQRITVAEDGVARFVLAPGTVTAPVRVRLAPAQGGRQRQAEAASP